MPGRDHTGRARFCAHCGTRVSVEPPAFVAAGVAPSSIGRVSRHVQILGILWCVSGALRLMAAAVVLVFLRFMVLRGFESGGWMPPVWFAPLIPGILSAIGLLAALSLVTGYGLLTRRSWGRTLALVSGILGLLHPPLGTALGVYTLWVLGPRQSSLEWNELSE